MVSLAQDVAATVERAYAVGTATGRVSALARTAETARLVSEAAPVAAAPQHAYTTADVFVEMGLAQRPRLDDWLRDVTRRLADGPDLVATLDAYYRADPSRDPAQENSVGRKRPGRSLVPTELCRLVPRY